MTQVPVRPRDGSDGDPTNVPPTGSRLIQADDDTKAAWLTYLAENWMKDRGEARKGVNYKLTAFPHGYTLWIKERPKNKANVSIVDKYVFGHPSGKYFDSRPIFYRHFKFLMDNNGDSMGCDCKLCGAAPFVGGGSKQQNASSRTSSHFTNHAAVLGAPDPPNPTRPRPSRLQARTLRAPPKAGTLVDVANKTEAQPEKRSQAPYFVCADLPLTSESPPKAPISELEDYSMMLEPGLDASRVDEEGTPDVYRNLINQLQRLPSHARLDVRIEEPLSPDWVYEQKTLPGLLRELAKNEQWLPRVGEIVLYNTCSDKKNRPSQPRDWKSGSIVDGPKILEQGNVTQDGMPKVKIQLLPDPNSSDKSASLKQSYIDLSKVIPFMLWNTDVCLKDVHPSKWHPSVSHGMALASTASLVSKYRFSGKGTTAHIFARGIYLGHELIVVGDTVRLNHHKPVEQIMVIRSISLVLSDLDKVSDNDFDDGPAYKSRIFVHGMVWTTSSIDTKPGWATERNSVIPKAASKEYGPLYPFHPGSVEMALPFQCILSRLYEYDALTELMRNAEGSSPKAMPDLDTGRESIYNAQCYAMTHDKRISEADAEWFWADTRAEALDVHFSNGMPVAFNDPERNIRAWRKQQKLAQNTNEKKEPTDDDINGSHKSDRFKQFLAPGPSKFALREVYNYREDTESEMENGDDEDEIRRATRIIEDEDVPMPKKKKLSHRVVVGSELRNLPDLPQVKS